MSDCICDSGRGRVALLGTGGGGADGTGGSGEGGGETADGPTECGCPADSYFVQQKDECQRCPARTTSAAGTRPPAPTRARYQRPTIERLCAGAVPSIT